MKYKVGDKVRVRGDLEVGELYGGEVFTLTMNKFIGRILTIGEEKYDSYWLDELMGGDYNFYFADEMLRPAEFKIWCETEEEKQAVLEELEKEGYVLENVLFSNVESKKLPVYFLILNNGALCGTSKEVFDEEKCEELTPSEFTGIDFSEKIIIIKTPTGAKATYKDKWSYVNGEFDDASRQALAEVLCPFKVRDKVIDKRCKNKGIVKEIRINGEVVVHLDSADGDYDMSFKTLELLELYTEPLYNAKLFCIEGHGVFKQGVVYTVENGIFVGVHGSHFRDLEDINTNLASQFMEVKGGLDE